MEDLLKEYELNRKINRFLFNSLEMKTSTIGMCYWINAISYCINNQVKDKQYMPIIREIYRYIADKHNTSVDCVEKAMRYAKETSHYKVYFNIENTLKNTDFLLLCLDRIVSQIAVEMVDK